MDTVSLPEEQLTKDRLIGLIPQTSTGSNKGGDSATDIHRMLTRYSYSKQELRMFEAMINNLGQKYGHYGKYVLGTRSKKRARW